MKTILPRDVEALRSAGGPAQSPEAQRRSAEARVPPRWVGVLAGLVSGITSFAAHAAREGERHVRVGATDDGGKAAWLVAVFD